MAIKSIYPNQFETKLAKKTSDRLYAALRYTCLSKNLQLQWQDLANKKRLYLRATWSNLQKAIDTFQILPELWDGKNLNARALSNLIEELQEAQENAVIHSPDDTGKYRYNFSPKEYQLQKECFQFVLDQFGFDYNWMQIPHEFKYQIGGRVYCHYKSIPYTSHTDNGGCFYSMEIDPTGSYHSGRWYTYGRSSLGWRAEGIIVDSDFLHRIYLVHEITHAVENYRSRRTQKKYTSSEMNTTLHELRYVRKHYPDIFRKLTPVQDGRRNRWWSPVPPLEGQNPEQEFQQSKKAAATSGK